MAFPSTFLNPRPVKEVKRNSSKLRRASKQKKALELSIQFLKRRAVSTKKVDKKLMKQFIAVLPISEVEAVLEMVVSGEFLDFYKKQKQQRHPGFI